VYGVYVGLFALGLIGLGAGRPRGGRIRALSLFVTSGLIFAIAADTVLNGTDYPPLALVSLVLFGAAALIPWSWAFQAFLVTVALGAVPAARLFFGRGVGEPGWWSWPVAQSPPKNAVFGAVGVALLGAVSVVITRTLYHLRERARVAERMGGYTLIRELGKGGGGTVYLAEHRRMCKPSAIKVITASPGRDAVLISRFEREIAMASRLDHPNTIEIRDYGRADASTFFLAMEYLVGLDLHQLVTRFGPIRPERTVHILAQVCDSLAEAHGKGIVHRDLKPPNVFVTRRGGVCDFVKVLDFGLAKPVAAPEGDTITRAGTIVGTPHFLAPEAALGNEPYGPRGDLYSLGCTAYWMLAGRPPYEGATAQAVIAAHLKRDPDPIDAASEFELPAALADAVMRCMRKTPSDRFGSATELGRALQAIRFAEPWTAEAARFWWDLHLANVDGESASTPPRTPSSP